MDDKTKNLVLWFCTLPFFASMVAYAFMKQFLIAGVVFAVLAPLSTAVSYNLYRKAKNKAS